MHEMRKAETSEVGANGVLTGVQIDTQTRKSCPLPAEIVERGRKLVRAYELPGYDQSEGGFHGKRSRRIVGRPHADGRFQGELKGFAAPELGAVAIRAAVSARASGPRTCRK